MNSVTNYKARQAMFVARMPALAAVRVFIDLFCVTEQLPHGAGLRLHLVAEELFTNTVKHGHRGGSDAPIVITMETREGSIQFTYEDQAPPFNPLAYAEKVKLADHLEGGKEGGLGAVLTRELATHSEYHYLFGHNRVRLSLAAS